MTTTTTTTNRTQAPALESVRAHSPAAARIDFVGRYKGLLATLVVMIHTGITYGAVGGWSFNEPHDVMWLKVLATCIGSFSQSFVLGAFFFLSAYFLPRSLAKKGALKLLGDRLVRLGIPFVLFYFVGSPFLALAIDNLAHGKHYGLGPNFGSGPLWFVEALFVFTALYAAFARIRKSRAPLFLPRGLPSVGVIAGYIGVAALLGFAARTVFPIGWSIHNQQLGFFPMYVLLFAAGIKAGQEGWLEQLAGVKLRLWAPLAIVGMVGYLPMMVGGGALEDPAPFLGGLHWQSAVYAVWEAVTGTSLFITTIVLFARRRWGTGKVASSFGEASYGVYLFHAFAIVLVGIAMLRLNVHPAIKYVLLTAAGVCIPWMLTEALKRVPGARRIL
jgi:glucans biosynthesis protein C